MKTKLAAVFDLMRLKKQYGTLLLLIPTLWSLILADGGIPSIRLLFIFTAGSFLTRSAGCVINDFADVEFDRHVERTRLRPLASGRLNRRDAIVVFFVIISICLVLLLQTNRLTFYLSPVALFLMVLYPFTKRYVQIPQVFLGAAFGWGAVMAWAAARNEVTAVPLLIFLATIFWATAYDTIYALMDVDDDIRIGVKSTAILFDKFCWAAIGLFYVLLIATLLLIGKISGLDKLYYVSLLAVSIIFLYHTWRIRLGPGRDELFKIFKANVMAGMLIMIGMLAGI